MTRLLKPATLIPAIAGLLLGIVLDVVKDYITTSGGVVLTVFVVLAALFGLGALWVQSRPHPAQAIMRSPVTLRTPVDRLTHARRGLIVFVSLYRPMGKEGSQLSPDERVKAAQAGDYAALDLPHSNLAPAITSITSHQHNLEHCWLIATAGNSQQPGSVTYAQVLARYLQEEAGLTDCHFYGADDDSLAVSLDDDALVASKTRDLVNRIFRQAEQLGLQDREIAADFTGCPRSMALGMFLACLDRNRDIQFVGTHYDDQGRPTGDLFPVLFAFEPEIITE